MRAVSWFSCGAASAVATKLALGSNSLKREVDEIIIAYCDIKQEHPDNMRFLKDCEKWFGQEILILGNDDFGRDTDRVFRETRYLVGPGGARCTGELKRSVRWGFQQPADKVIIGFTTEEETKRGARLRNSEPTTDFVFPLVEQRYSKQMCYDAINAAGIELPMMYRLGYNNNNCIGCVKGQAGYWNKIRVDFPERFAEMAKIERELGRTICKREWTKNGKRYLERVYLDEMSPDLGNYRQEGDIACGILCASSEAAE
jgi:3'-phosphoadenosine 5'-phosphosulfate sulfotransferase (PAPS reductase)/FAD synthetase